MTSNLSIADLRAWVERFDETDPDYPGVNVSSIRMLLAAYDEVQEERDRWKRLADDPVWQQLDELARKVVDVRLEVQAPPLQWTREPPTKPGWYWRRHPMGATWAVFCDEVYQHRGQLCRMGDIDVTASPDCEWAGPIPEPRDPASFGEGE